MTVDQAARPARIVVDCRTGAVTHTELTDEEIAADAERQAQAVAEEQARLAGDEALRAAVAAHPDPVVQSLAARLGLTPGPH